MPLHSSVEQPQKLNNAALLDVVRRSIYTARQQVSRSAKIISQSHEIVGKSKLELARSNLIRRWLAGEQSANPEQSADPVIAANELQQSKE